MKPALSHFFNMVFSMGLWAKSQSCERLSKHDRLSPSKIHGADRFEARTMKPCLMASAVQRSGRNPSEFRSPMTSAMELSASKEWDGMALQSMQGIITAHYLL